MAMGCSGKEFAEKVVQAAPAPPALSRDLAVVQQSKGPIMTTLEEFYKMGPGPVEFTHNTECDQRLGEHVRQSVVRPRTLPELPGPSPYG
jgi:hypothetical protein